MTANGRPKYLMQVLESWRQACLFADMHPRRMVCSEPGPKAAVVRNLVRGTPWLLHQNEEKLGPLVNPFQMFEMMRAEMDYGVMLLAEDDAVVSRDALTCLFGMVDLAVEPDRTLFCLNQNGVLPVAELDKSPLIVGNEWFSPTVWGLTTKLWDEVVRDSWDHDYSFDGWDWNLNRKVIPNEGLTVLSPVQSRSTHIGLLDGAHTTAESYVDSVSDTFDPDSCVRSFRLGSVTE